MLLSLNLYAQNEYKIKGNPKSYTETYFGVNKINDQLIKGEETNEEFFKINIYNVLELQYKEKPEKWEVPKEIYNSLNQKIESIEYNDEGEIINKTKYYYDINNKLIEEKFYFESDNLILNTTYLYKNDLLDIKTINDFSTLSNGKHTISYVIYKYDNNNLISEHYKSITEERLSVYKYDNNNNLIETYYNYDFPANEEKLQLCKKITYIKFDKFNWTEIFIEDNLCIKNEAIKYFLVREYKY